jgi:hypothetical protein
MKLNVLCDAHGNIIAAHRGDGPPHGPAEGRKGATVIAPRAGQHLHEVAAPSEWFETLEHDELARKVFAHKVKIVGGQASLEPL